MPNSFTLDQSKWHVTKHASERWCERVQNTRNTIAARNLILAKMMSATHVPNRLAAPMWSKHTSTKSIGRQRRNGMRYYVSGNTVFLTSGETVVTVWLATPDEWATVITWMLMGIWCPERVDDVTPPNR